MIGGGALEALVTSGLPFDPEPAHLVGTGGAIGAIARHLVYVRLSTESFPLATLTVNVLGSALFAFLVFGGAGESTVQLVGIGACGAFTTFSTFSVETVQLWERGQRGGAVVNAMTNLFGSLAGIGVAWLLLTL